MTGVAAARVVRLDTWQTKAKLTAGVLIGVVITTYFLVAASRADHTTKRVAGVVFGALALLATLALLAGARYAASRRSLVLSEDGIAYDSRRRPWRIGWPELTSARIDHGYTRGRGKQYLVRLVLIPARPDDFARQHPTLRVDRARFGAGPDEWSVPFASARELIEPIAAGLQEFGGPADGGTRDLGRIYGAFL